MKAVNISNGKRTGWLAIAAALALIPPVAMAAPERVGDFALLDSEGEFHQLSRYQHARAVAIMSLASSCADQTQHLKQFEQLAARFSEDGIAFLLLDSDGRSRAALQEANLDFPVLEDRAQLVSASLGMTHAGDVRLLSPQRLNLLYRGPVTANGFGDTVQSLLAGEALRETVQSPSTEACSLSYPVRDKHLATPPDYATEIAPLIIEKCAECHRQGGVGPFQIDRHITLLGWSPMIREVLLTRRMPPTQTDPHAGLSATSRTISDAELQTLVHWIDAGAPRGRSETDPLEEFSYPDDRGWVLGTPDHIVSAPPNSIPATGLLNYLHTDVDLAFSGDRWLRAVQFIPGSQAVLHHLMAVVTAPGEDFWGAERDHTVAERRFVEAYLPGRPSATTYPADTAIHIPEGHRLSLQFHYMTNGQATVDETQIGLYFSSRPPAHELKTLAVSSHDFVLPPNAEHYPVEVSHRFDKEVVITGVRARMQYRGKSMKFSAQLPDGSRQDLFSVPAYNYGWQPHYVLDEAVRLPAGSQVIVAGSFDNSISNPANPDPDKEVRFSLESGGEMFTGYFTFYHP